MNVQHGNATAGVALSVFACVRRLARNIGIFRVFSFSAWPCQEYPSHTFSEYGKHNLRATLRWRCSCFFSGAAGPVRESPDDSGLASLAGELRRICPTSKMSHDGSWRAACRITIRFRQFHFESLSVARGVTDPGVGSGALFGGLNSVE